LKVARRRRRGRRGWLGRLDPISLLLRLFLNVQLRGEPVDERRLLHLVVFLPAVFVVLVVL
jgi:hypothetical protein